MSSALKPALPPGVGQTAPANPPSAPGKSLTAGQNMAQHGGPPAPYATGPLGHIPQSLAGLPHAHSNLGMPSTNSTNIAANMSMNAIPTNMSGMTGHPGMNQTSPLNVPSKGAALPPTVAVAGHGRQATHPYLAGGGATPTGTMQPPRDTEGTTLPLPASQNSAQLMAMHRAQQHQPVLHPQQPQQQQQQHDQSASDRFKQQLPLQQQSQSNGTVTGPSEPLTTCNNKTITVPATTATQADATKTETPPSAVPTVQNHVPTSSSTTGTHEPNSETKQPPPPPPPLPPPPPPPIPTTTVTTEVTSSTSSSNNTTTSPPTQPIQPTVETKTNVATPTAVEPEPVPNAAITPTKAVVVVPKEPLKAPTTLKLATTPRTTNRKRETKPPKTPEPQKASSTLTKTDSRSPVAQNSKPPDKVNKNRTPSEDERKSKRTRTRTQPYQSPIPELALITKLSSVSAASSPSKSQDEKLIVFYKNEFLAVRNAEGGFYVCQAVQNVYKSSPRIRIRWLSQDKQDKIYIPDFYDFTDFDCILTNINMERVEKGKYNLPKDELERTENILKRALAVESGASAPSLTEEHPDGLDLSLFRDESQLKKKRKSTTKRKSTIGISLSEDSDDSDYDSKPKRTPDKAKVRRVSRTSSRSSTKRNNQSSDRKSTTPNAINDKKDNTIKTGRRSADGGRAERAKRRGEGSGASLPKTSPVVDHKKARVLAKTMKTTIPAVTQSKKKVGKNAVPVAKTTGNATVSVVKTSTKTATRSQGSVASSSSGAASSTAAASSSVLPTRRGKKTKK